MFKLPWEGLCAILVPLNAFPRLQLQPHRKHTREFGAWLIYPKGLFPSPGQGIKSKVGVYPLH